MKLKIKNKLPQKFSVKQIFEYRLIRVSLVLAVLVGVLSLVVITRSSISDTFAFTSELWGYDNSCKVSESSIFANQLDISEAENSTVCKLGNNQGNIPGSWNKNDYKTIAFIAGYNFETPQDASSLFWKYQNLESFAVTPSLITFDTSNTTNMAHMFRELKIIKSGEVEKLLAKFNTLNVTDMQYMFADDEGIETLNLNYSGFNTTNVTNMHGMFVGMPNLTTLTLGSNFNTSNVTDMAQAFRTNAVYDSSTGNYGLQDENKLKTIIINTDLNLTADAGLRGIWCAGSSYCYVGDTGNAGQLKLIGGSTTTYERMIELNPNFTPDSHTYTGQEQSVTITGYDSSTMELSGQTSGTDAGDYYAYITPKLEYAWNQDGRYAPKAPVEVKWTIGESSNPPQDYTEISKPSTNPSALEFNNQERTAPGYNSTTMDYSGTLKATNAGSYTVSVTPKTGYKWTGGTNEAVTINWTINRVQAPEPTNTPTGLTGFNGDAIGSVSLAAYPGFSWANGSDTIQLGSNQYDAIYNPDTDNYTNRNITLTVTGVERTPEGTRISKPSTNPTAIKYDGTPKTVPGYNSSTMNVTGQSTATDIGSYTATVTPKSGYIWTDDTSSGVTITWSIVKGTPTRPSDLKDKYEGIIGKPLSEIALPSSCVWEEEDTKVTAGTNAHYVNCNPDPTKYDNLRIQVNVEGVESEDPDEGDEQEKSGTDGDSQNDNKKANTPNTGVGGSASSFVKAVGSALAIITPLVAITIVAVKKHHKKVDFTR